MKSSRMWTCVKLNDSFFTAGMYKKLCGIQQYTPPLFQALLLYIVFHLAQMLENLIRRTTFMFVVWDYSMHLTACNYSINMIIVLNVFKL